MARRAGGGGGGRARATQFTSVGLPVRFLLHVEYV